jgi:hypothetical protein
MELELDGRRLRGRYMKVRVRKNGVERVYHYLSLGSKVELLDLLGRKVEVKLTEAQSASRAVAATAELPQFPRQYLTLPCTEKILKLLELAGGCIDMKTSDVGMAVMCAASTIKAALKRLKEEGKIAEEGWRICVSR